MVIRNARSAPRSFTVVLTRDGGAEGWTASDSYARPLGGEYRWVAGVADPARRCEPVDGSAARCGIHVRGTVFFHRPRPATYATLRVRRGVHPENPTPGWFHGEWQTFWSSARRTAVTNAQGSVQRCATNGGGTARWRRNGDGRGCRHQGFSSVKPTHEPYDVGRNNSASATGTVVGGGKSCGAHRIRHSDSTGQRFTKPVYMGLRSCGPRRIRGPATGRSNR